MPRAAARKRGDDEEIEHDLVNEARDPFRRTETRLSRARLRRTFDASKQ
jgi:hypothetical protein